MTRVYAGVEDDGRLLLPTAVRSALRLEPGDRLVIEIEGARATLARLATMDHLDALAETLPEWASDADALAYDAI